MLRLATSFGLLGLWLFLLLIGWTLGGVIHLLLITAVICFPWKEATRPVPDSSSAEEPR